MIIADLGGIKLNAGIARGWSIQQYNTSIKPLTEELNFIYQHIDIQHPNNILLDNIPIEESNNIIKMCSNRVADEVTKDMITNILFEYLDKKIDLVNLVKKVYDKYNYNQFNISFRVKVQCSYLYINNIKKKIDFLFPENYPNALVASATPYRFNSLIAHYIDLGGV